MDNLAAFARLTASKQDLQHNLIMMCQDNKLHLCPAGQDRKLQRVLDGGCGSGIWTMDFGK